MLHPDSSELTVQIFLQVSLQLSAISASTTGRPANTSFAPPSFSPSTSTIVINTSWFECLVSSVVAASLAILIKQSLRKARADLTGPDQFARPFVWVDPSRLRRVAGSFPLPLQLSLVLFLVGMMESLVGLNGIVATILVNIFG